MHFTLYKDVVLNTKIAIKLSGYGDWSPCERGAVGQHRLIHWQEFHRGGGQWSVFCLQAEYSRGVCRKVSCFSEFSDEESKKSGPPRQGQVGVTGEKELLFSHRVSSVECRETETLRLASWMSLVTMRKKIWQSGRWTWSLNISSKLTDSRCDKQTRPWRKSTSL